MRLGELMAELPVEGADEAGVDVTGVAHDSRRVAPGDLFVAWRGERFDGTDFAAQAMDSGAVAVLAPEGAQRPEGVPADLPWLHAADPHRLLAPLSARLYRHPDRELITAGVTGTNGKSTVATLLAEILEAAGHPAGLLGSLGYRYGGKLYQKGRTTPEASDLYRLLRTMRDHGAASLAMEVSSHALALGRVDGMAFDLAVFTNLSRDHLDFHADMEDYFQAKRQLFLRLKDEGALAHPGRAAINSDDEHGRRLIDELPADRVVTWGEETGDVHVVDADLDETGIRARFTTPRGELAVESLLLGHFNLLNLLAAVAGAEALELDPSSVRDGIARLRPLPGRMQPVKAGQPFPVFVDYCHTPLALEAALKSLRRLSGRRLVVVFGCGGDRDRGKRPQMGRIAGDCAELPILTSDNPRTEDPQRILDEVEVGVKESGNEAYRVVVDRREAIALAMELADEDSLVLIAGKGDEPIQVVGTRELPFYDHDEAVKALRRKLGNGGGIGDGGEASGAA